MVDKLSIISNLLQDEPQENSMLRCRMWKKKETPKTVQRGPNQL